MRTAAILGLAALASGAACGGRTELDLFADASESPALATGQASDTATDASAPYHFVGAACAEGGVPVCSPVLDIPAGRFWEGCFYVECQRHGACRRCTCREDGGWQCEAVGCPFCPFRGEDGSLSDASDEAGLTRHAHSDATSD